MTGSTIAEMRVTRVPDSTAANTEEIELNHAIKMFFVSFNFEICNLKFEIQLRSSLIRPISICL